MKKYILILICIAFSNYTFSRNYASSINYKHVQGLVYEFEVIVYSDTMSIHPMLRLYIGNDILNINKYSQLLNGDSALVKYKGTYSFQTEGKYTVIAETGYRMDGVLNVVNSLTTTMSLTTEINASHQLNNTSSNDSIALIGHAIVSTPYSVDLSSFDIDGDSLSYKLIPCRSSWGTPYPGYNYPDSTFLLDDQNGLLTWDSPKQSGLYAILISIEEYRSDTLISKREKEFLIIVDVANNIFSVNNRNELLIYPNPFTNVVTFDLLEHQYQLEIYNTQGGLMLSKMVSGNQQVNLQDFSCGIYIYKLTNTKNQFQGRLIKL